MNREDYATKRKRKYFYLPVLDFEFSRPKNSSPANWFFIFILVDHIKTKFEI